MFYKYPKIESLKAVKCDINKLVGVGVMPTINLKGTVKIHGDNGGVTLERDGAMHVQSRNRVLSIQSDNKGFCIFCEPNQYFPSIANTLFNQYSHFNYITLYGEWCGGNNQAGCWCKWNGEGFCNIQCCRARGGGRTTYIYPCRGCWLLS